MKRLYLSRHTQILLCLALMLYLAPHNARTQTVDESKSPLSQGIMTHTDWLCFDIAPVTNDITLAPGIVNFRLRVVPHWKCESFQVDVVEVDNLKYFGEMSWTFEASAGDTVYFPISVELPENDTTGMVFEVGGCECRLHTAAYFTTTAVDAKFYRSDPSKSGDRLIEARDAANRREIERARDSIAQLPPPPPVPESYSGVGYFGKDGNFYPGDSVPPDFEPWVPEIDKQGGTLSSQGGGDSRVARAVYPSRGMSEAERQEYERQEKEKKKEKKTAALYAEMREKEKQPCTTGSERYGVGGEVWTRRKGENNFRKLEPVTDIDAYIEELKQRRLAEGIKPETHITLDLRRADDLEFVRTLVDSLIPQEDAGIYETVVMNAELNKIIKRGILWNYYPMKPSKRPGIPDTQPKRRSAPEEPSGSSSRGRDTLFFDGGETNWPSQWTIRTDYNDTSGLDYWGRVDYFYGSVHNGDSSIWCAEVGDMPEGQYYDNYMRAVMTMTGGIDISTGQNDTGKYVYLNATENTYDWFLDLGSFDGIEWYTFEAYTGYSNGWDSMTFGISSDQNRYYQQFGFNSDASGHEGYAGTYLDDISFTASAPPPPRYVDLECCTPSGWSGPIVLSSAPWPDHNDSLTAAEITYIDIAIKNTGDTLASAFNVDILVDGEWCVTKYVDNLAPGQCITWLDEQIIVDDTSWQTISVEIDPNGWISESNENNNTCQQQGYFYSPPRFPNLEPGWGPGWAGSIVPSMIRGNHQSGTLYSGDTTYIDWAVRNTGDTASGPFWTRLKYDGQVIQNIQVPSIPASQNYLEEDFSYFIPLADSGTHTLEIDIDYTWQVDELFENDNFYGESFEWESATIGAQIQVEFQQLKNASGGIWHVADSVRVELRDADPGDTGQVLATGWTSTSGLASLGLVLNREEDQTPQDIFIRVYSENPHAVVGGTEYSVGQHSRVYPRTIDSDTLVDAGNGWHWWQFPLGFPVAADTVDGKYFYIANTVQEGHRLWASLTSGMHDPGKTHVLTKENVHYNKTHYSFAEDIIRVENSRYAAPAPDCYDRDPILHELGHRLAFTQQFFDDVPDTMTYSYTSILPPGLAANEGFAGFWCAVADMGYFGDLDSVMDDSFNDYLDTTYKNYESGRYGQKGATVDTTVGTVNTQGPLYMGSVTGILWDIYDDNSDNFSGWQDWGDTLLPHHPDSVWDSLSDGANNILAALLTRDVNGHHPDDIDEFWDVWFNDPELGNCPEMEDIFYEHGIDVSKSRTVCPCCNLPGDVNNSGALDISDLVYIVDFMFMGGPEPSCPAHANINGSNRGVPDYEETMADVDISDLVYMVDYMFTGGPVLPDC